MFPALAIAEELALRGFSPLYVGSDRGLEARLAPEKGIPFFVVKSAAIKNQGFFKILVSLWRLAWGFLWALFFLLRHRPKAVVGVGGYVSVPIVTAAFVLRRPIYIQEQNVSVGIANRLLGKLATKVMLGFPQAASYFPNGVCLETGNPIRRDFARVPPYRAECTHLLVMGGSQGARAINQAIVRELPWLKENFPHLRIRHQTGRLDLENVRQGYKEAGVEADVVAFIDDMVAAYSQANLIVCRSGALTVSELIAVGRPSILVPYPRKGQNDQTANAGFLQAAGAGLVVEEGEAFQARIHGALETALSAQTLDKMNKSYSALQKPNALVTIGDLIEGDVRPQAPSTQVKKSEQG